MRGNYGDKARLQHMMDAIDEIESFVKGCDLKDFESNSMMRFACIKLLEIIGEAGNHISVETKNKFANVEWRQITGMRNIFVHEYFGIDTIIVWNIISKDIPEFKIKIAEILKSLA